MARNTRNLNIRLMSGAAAVAMLMGAGHSYAQTAASEATVEELIVTGTAIRGIAPVGSNVQSISTEEIKRTGAISANQILANIPVITSQFNTTANTPTSVFLNVFRPNIRNISSSGGNTTLVLVDGHNQVGVGTLQTTPDAGIIPAGALERVEVLADGGSALYGADAVGGIVNYITRTKFEGFEVSARYGQADGGYNAYDFNLTGGHEWDDGGVLLAFSTRANTPLYTNERDRPRAYLVPFGGTIDTRSRACDVGNIAANGTTYRMDTRVPGSLNLCDLTALGNIAPEEHSFSGFLSFHQKLADNLTFEMKGLYGDRTTKSRSAQLTGTNAIITANNPFFRPVAGETSQVVNFSFAPYLGARAVANSHIKQYSVTPQLTWDVGNDWQIKALYNRGYSITDTTNPSLAPQFASLLNGPGLTTANAINPYNVLATSPQTLSLVTGAYKLIGYARQSLDDVRVQGDGPLFDLPGGTVRAAVGVEWAKSTLDAYQGTPATSINDPNIGRGKANRTVKALFGQVNIPIIGDSNALPLVQSFAIDLSARYDDYSDFGSTTNPKVAFTWEVIDGLQLRGNFGSSFNAPSLADTTGGADARLEYIATTGAIRPGDPASSGQRPTITISGGKATLQPQTADTYSFGVDYTPSFFDNLQLSASYWSVELEDRIGLATTGATLYTIPAYASYYVINPTLAQLTAARGNNLPLQNFPSNNLADLYGNGVDPYRIVDLRRDNFGTFKVKGVDFRAAYRQPMEWGDIFASVSGTRGLKRESQNGAASPATDELAANISKLSLSTTLGVNIGAFTASVTQNRSQGYDITGVVNQTKVKSFAPINLAFRYDFSGEAIYNKDLSVSLNIDNVGDDLPPFINSGTGTANGSTLGRYINVGLRKLF
jgi:iron complex outermembrane receptor protein